MQYNDLTLDQKISRVLELVPQQAPFRFVDRLIELGPDHVMGQYTFRHDEWFYRGHFPGNPVTPGVILLESMAQIGIVAMAMHLMLEEGKDPQGYITYFQEAQVEFLKPVYPGDTVTIKGEKLLWRRAKMRAKVDLYVGETLAVSGVLNGFGVRS